MGLTEEKLVRTYKTLIRPSVEYVAPAWHSMLTAAQASTIEQQQILALKNIFGYNLSAKKLRSKTEINLLSKRRETLVKKFVIKSLSNARCVGWFEKRNVPRYSRRSGVNYPTYKESPARTDRHRNTPMNYIIRKLNET